MTTTLMPLPVAQLPFLLLLLLSACLPASGAFGQDGDTSHSFDASKGGRNSAPAPKPEQDGAKIETGWPKAATDDSASPFALNYRKSKPRKFWLFPALSMILPGLDQMIEGQWSYGLGYAGAFWGGVIGQLQQLDELQALVDSKRFGKLSDEEKADELKFSEVARRSMLASQISLASGSFSAYHAFRTAVRSQQPYGRFGFLKHEETLSDLLLAPFHFSYLKRPSTYVPLIVIASLWLAATELPPEHYAQRQLTSSDAFYSGAFSYLAGTHEEALFRGYLMPAMRESFSNDFWSNTLSSLVFAAAHLSTVQVPVTQFFLGWHLGRVTQNNGWRIGEAIFIHAWWDVIAFAMNYQFRYQEGGDKKARLPLTLPPIALYF